MDIQFTQEQQSVIDHENGDLLVSAAAGSGKTAVLVARVLRMLTDPTCPVPLSNLLIVTFTNAAAEQMKEKIEKAILSLIENGKGTPFLEEQLREVPSSHIQTNHAFSLFVLKQYITRIPGLDPGFRVADEAEAQLLKINVLRDSLEYFYSEALKPDPSQEAKDFLTFVDCYGGRTQDSSVEKLLLDVYRFMESEPDPSGWLSHAVRQTDPGVPVGLSSELAVFRETLIRSFDRMIGLYKEVIEDAPEKSKEKVRDFVNQLEQVNSEIMDKTDREAYMILRDVTWPRAVYQFKWHPDGEEDRRKLYDQIKKQTQRIVSFGDLCFDPKVEELRQKYHYPAMKGLEAILRYFMDQLRKEKDRRNLIEIGDFEHYCLDLLKDPLICQDLQKQFAYIFVDEYQDCSGIQEAILQKIARRDEYGHSCNLFLVGDIKQSIYRFRQADPGLFLEKYKTYGKLASTRRLLLSRNFRSTKKILETVNFVFHYLMTEEIGGLSYGKKEELYPGIPETPDGEDVQLFVRCSEELSSEDLTREEARFTAKQIRGEILSGRRPGEIVLLMRSMTASSVYLEELKQLGIACICDSSENFYDTKEIQTVINVLRIIDNPRQDIPLLGVLLSVVGGFSEDDLGKLRIASSEGDLFEALLAFCEKGTDPQLKEKTERFLGSLTEWRTNARILTVRDLLWYLYRSTGLYLYFQSMERGRERSANLDLLIRKAESFENGTFHGLFAFLQYIEQMNKDRQEEAEAKVLETGMDTVRLMTIHKSKGLEFPVVYLAGLGRSFNMQDINSICQMHHRYGLGLPLTDADHQAQMDSVFSVLIRNEKKKEMIAEELRLLYVAMTRAMDKLVLVGSTKKDFSISEKTGPDKTEKILSAESFLSQIRLVLEDQGPGPLNVSIRSITKDEGETDGPDPVRESFSVSDHQEIPPESFSEKLSYIYPHLALGRTPQLISVSSIKEEALDEIEEVTGPDEAAEFEYSEGRLSGSERGTLFHTIVAMADPGLLEEGRIEQALDDLVIRGVIRKESLKEISYDWIRGWAGCDLFRRMRRSREVYHEEPFVMSVPISEIKKISRIADEVTESEGKEIMIQGIIDLFFKEEDGWVLVDYKTDKVLDDAKIHGYGVQLSLYQRAIEKATNVKVKEKMLFDVRRKREIRC
ncbi:MAG: helicase-exonuclease AddAB subunit AddA [Firmicutes bacterium]|nr:helicase-exonuclease AddAB subunit AddA [Bacillota bacterium]